MLRPERHEQILRELSCQAYLGVEEAASRLGASVATVRRDFAELAARGLAERTRGGLRRSNGADGHGLPFALREVRFSREKAAMAAYAAGLLSPEDVLMVDGGTTTYHLARVLPDVPLKVITNSLRLAAALGERRPSGARADVFLTGGYLFPESGLLAGPQTVASLEQYHARWAFLSPSGICAEGVFNTNEFVVESERVMMTRAERVVVLADASKLGARSMCRVGGLASVHLLITVAAPGAEEALASFRDAGVEVVVLPAEDGPDT